jgi:hypothetical protein
MTPPPQTRGQLLTTPLLAVCAGALPAFFLSPLLGVNAAMWLALVLSGCTLLALGYMAYRSVYGTAHGVTAASVTFLWFGLVVAASAAALLVIQGHAGLAWLSLATSAAVHAVAFAASARTVYNGLQAEGLNGAWLRSSVNFEGAWVIDQTLAVPAPSGAWRSPWIIAAVAVNLPLLWRGYGVSDNAVMPWIAIGMNLAGLWLMVSFAGPLLGRALYVRRLEQQAGVTLTHRDIRDLQRLRASLWLSRWLMPTEAVPDEPPSKLKRRR